MDPTVYGAWLWTLTALLVGRVAGQILVAWRAPINRRRTQHIALS